MKLLLGLVLMAAVIAAAIWLWIKIFKVGKKAVIAGSNKIKEVQANNAQFEEKRKALHGFDAGKYLTGHPMMSVPVRTVYVGFEGVSLVIFGQDKNDVVRYAEIPISSIQKAEAIDFASMKRRANTIATHGSAQDNRNRNYVSIKWKDGKFVHDTIFEINSFKSVQQANALQSAIVRVASAAQ